MAKKEVLKVEHVGMKFNLSQEKVDDLKDYVIKLLSGQPERLYFKIYYQTDEI